MDRPDSRSDARERALYLLYEAQAKGLDPVDIIDLQVIAPDELTQLLVRGVAASADHLDEMIAARADGWTLARMPVIDVNVMRLGIFELTERPDVPTAVVLDEAVELAKRYSTDDSGRFVNGVLAAIAAEVRD
ncbi:MAG: transcription antitermination factor NusB [Ilumatobacter coccineus]|uniref:Transcription antitermination protein NusB n=1 Tax=Ilumatobacter coccineus TaxID=467094 RepID=A0A2G6KE56_9ACTN|nr:MAG: transcription antitermination factor NusB [Ilumatobacter coccineus]